MRNHIIFGVFCILIMTIGLSTMNTSNDRLDRIIDQDSEISNADSTQIKLKEETDISIELHCITDFVIDYVIPAYIDFMNSKINQNRNKRHNLNGENNDF
ncbi:hypothetical protein C6497_04815 [Candidatus Poribacteria bacterium]|nr:MAG: hypothetical protein C6497_04815 [Candidatus Poribacteria bacterium]